MKRIENAILGFLSLTSRVANFIGLNLLFIEIGTELIKFSQALLVLFYRSVKLTFTQATLITRDGLERESMRGITRGEID